MLSVIAQAVTNPDVDTAKMSVLHSILGELRAEEARIAFTQAFVGLNLPSIDRDGRIDEGITRSGRQGKKTRYATFENLNAQCDPILRKAGFALWFEPDTGPDGKITVRAHLDHVKGHGKSCALPLGLDTTGAKNPAQSAVSSVSYGKRVTMIAILNIQTHAPEDADKDGALPAETITGPQAKKLLKALDESGLETARFIEKYKINAAHELPARLFDEVMDALANYKAEREKRESGNAKRS
jgi:hypothetical protein